MKKTLVIGIIIILLNNCKSEPKSLEDFMVDISEFKINNSILKDGDSVEIIGSTGNLTIKHKIDFYNLIVVRSIKTGDTINVLVTNFFETDLNNPITRFLSNSTDIGKIYENIENSKSLGGKKIKNLRSKSYKKVFYDSEFIQTDVRKYPATTGNLADFKISETFH